MTDEPNAIEELQQKIEVAAGRVHFYKGQRLEPFSVARQAAFQRMGANSWESTLEGLGMIVYLCTLGEKLVDGNLTGIDCIERARGEDEIKKFRKLFFAWLEKEGVTFNNNEGREIGKIGEAIWEDTKVSRFVPEIETQNLSPPND